MTKVKQKGGVDTKFKGKGLGTKGRQQPVGAVLPPKYDVIVRSIPNRSEWIRKAIIEKLERDGMLEQESKC